MRLSDTICSWLLVGAGEKHELGGVCGWVELAVWLLGSDDVAAGKE